jgi:hypothetical protein
VLEAAVVFWLAEMPVSQSALRNSKIFHKSFLEDKLFSKEKLLPTAISVGVTALVAIILAFAGPLSKSAAQTYLFLSLFLLQLSFLARICFAEKARPQIKRSLIVGGVAVGVILLLTLLSALIAPLGIVTGMGDLTPLSAILLPLCPVLYFVLHLLLPFLHRTAK